MYFADFLVVAILFDRRAMTTSEATWDHLMWCDKIEPCEPWIEFLILEFDLRLQNEQNLKENIC